MLESTLENWCYIRQPLTPSNSRLNLILVGNDRGLPLPRYRNADISRLRGMIDICPVCEYFAPLRMRELHNGGYSRVVRGDTQTRRKVSKGGIQPESDFLHRIFHVCVDDVFGNTAPYREARFEGSMQDTNATLLAPSATAL